jgi:hypothetical protein
VNQEREPAVDAPELLDKALNLREAVNSSKARMFAQREQLNRLRAELSALRALAEARPALPARAATRVLAPAAAPAVARPVPAARPAARVLKEPVADSAPAPVSLRTTDPASLARYAPYAAILLVAVAVQLRPGPRVNAGVPLAAIVPPSPAAAPAAPVLEEEDASAEALLLVNEYRLPGDERPLSERLGAAGDPPGARSAWTAERTGERAYRVSYRPADGAQGYDFDVDLDLRRVDPTPETAELISPQLASRR